MNHAHIIYAKRTPIGRFKGQLACIRPDDLLARLLEDFLKQELFSPDLVDDIQIGCANQAGEDNRNIARMSSLLAGFPFEIPAVTINRLCGSGLQAAISAWTSIQTGLHDCVIVGGVESMSRAPYVLSKALNAYDGKQQMFDTSLGWRFPNPEMNKRFPLWNNGETAEEVALKLNIGREQQDQFAYQSHQKAIKAWDEGYFTNEVLPIKIDLGKGKEMIVSKDEGPRADTSIDQLSKLPSVFKNSGSVTAGNSSTLNDGAAVLVIASETFVNKHKLDSLARITGAAVRGIHPNIMGLGPVKSTEILCQKYQMKLDDFDVIEINEAFAVQVLGCIEQLKLDPTRVNSWGGAISLGHPLGCSGARILTTAISQLKANQKKRKALATMCIGVGQGISLSIESCF